MKKIFFIFLFLTVFLHADSQPTGTPTPGYIIGHPGQTIPIFLDSNPTTGYSWIVNSEKSDYKKILQLRHTGYQHDKKNTHLVGSGGKQYWFFHAKKPGTAHLYFEYQRPWEKKSVDHQQYMIVIKIKDRNT